MGGLGNQLFQIFNTISYAIDNKIKFIFPYSLSLADGIERPTYWNSFLESLNIFTTLNNDLVDNDDLYKFPLFRENGFNYHSLPVFKVNTMIYGYWQSYKYFHKFKDIIFKMMRLRQLKQIVLDEYSDLFDESNLVSMHFRLGDYKYKLEYHPILTYEYYEKSLEKIIENSENKNIKVLYFCEKEDNNVVSEHIIKLSKKYVNISFKKIDDSIPDWKQMLIMTNCNHNIIANSTFSWWGAYMNLYEKKIVCYPSIWFGVRVTQNRSHDEYMKDLYPEDWIKIVL
jgi:hypothetical protein